MVANKATTISTHLVKTAQKFHSIYMFSYGMCQQGRVDSKKTLHEQNPPVINAGWPVQWP